MSILYLRARPIVAFDVTDHNHRRYFHDFLKTDTWGHCPVRFMIESLNTDLVTYIANELLRYYDEKAFREYDKKQNKGGAKPYAKGTSAFVQQQFIQAKSSAAV